MIPIACAVRRSGSATSGTRSDGSRLSEIGALIYCDPDGRETGYDDVFTKIEMCRRHFEAVGLGGDYVKRFVR
jgi:hypothetical protein